ncbi:MAG: YajG family lipoprotein [Reinekea sp.]
MRPLIVTSLITTTMAMLMLLNAGCAQLSPQEVTLKPSIDTENLVQGIGSVELIVMDARVDRVIGSRGGAYASTSKITTKQPPEQLIEALALQVMAKAGLDVTSSFADKQMQIRLDGLSYKTEKYKTSVKRTTVKADISIEVTSGGTLYKNSYQSSEYQDTVGYPSEEKNEEMLNNVFNRVLNHMFSDPALSEFLQQN